jgi:hypothetical protein
MIRNIALTSIDVTEKQLHCTRVLEVGQRLVRTDINEIRCPPNKDGSHHLRFITAVVVSLLRVEPYVFI